MKSKLHAAAGVLSFLFIATFWSSTVVSELFLSHGEVASVRNAIVYSFMVFVPCMAITGTTGFAMGGKSSTPILVTKRRRMPFIGLNGLVVLIPAAIFLNIKAQMGEFDAVFYSVQLLELLAGATNLVLMGLNIRDGRRITSQANSSDQTP
jgi:hypothetical protein